MGSALAFVGVFLTTRVFEWADPVASMGIGVIIVLVGLNVLRENVDLLLGRAPDREFLERIIETAGSVEGVLGIHDLRAEYVGPGTVHAGFHITVAPDTSVEKANQIADDVHERVLAEADCQYCIVHVDAAVGSSVDGTVRRKTPTTG